MFRGAIVVVVAVAPLPLELGDVVEMKDEVWHGSRNGWRETERGNSSMEIRARESRRE